MLNRHKRLPTTYLVRLASPATMLARTMDAAVQWQLIRCRFAQYRPNMIPKGVLIAIFRHGHKLLTAIVEIPR